MSTLNVVIIIVLTFGLSTTASFAKGNNHAGKASKNHSTATHKDSPSWTVKSSDDTSVTLQSKEDVKQLKIAQMTDIIIDGVAKKPQDITTGMKVLSFIAGGDGTSVSRLVLVSAKDTSSDNKAKGKKK